jgi:thioredoxin-related protein
MKSHGIFVPLIAALALFLSCSLEQAADDAGWQTDYKTALEQAAKQNKYVLLDFTGSDWCGWCIQLSKDTFSKPAFKEYADKNLILVELDFPNNKMQSDLLIKQNQELQQKYQVEGFPTLILLDPKGREVARNVGYLQGGPQGFINWVKSAQKG